MGSGASKPHEEKLVYQRPRDGATFTSNETDTILLFQGDSIPWQNNCIFTKDSLDLVVGLTVRIGINGTGVIRFGLTTVNPSLSVDFRKYRITEHEDGFEKTDNVRKISMDAFHFITYANEDRNMKKDLTEIPQNTKSWLYIIVVYGCPKISVKKDERFLGLKNFPDSNVNIHFDEVVPGKTSSSGLCRLEKPVSLDHTYCINWQMKLEQTNSAHHCCSCKYGFFRLGFITEILGSLNRLSIHADQNQRPDTWFVSSAVSSTLYSEMITFTINRTTGQITHNLVMAPVHGNVTENFPLDCSKKLYLVLEVFHGDICGVQKYPPKLAPKPEFPGQILLFENFRPDNYTPEHIQIGAKFETQPCRIQYGLDPTLVLAEFRKKFRNIRPQQLKENQILPWDSVIEVKETSNVQVLDVPDNVTAEDLDILFSNRSITGGGEIRKILTSEYIRGCWIIEYKYRSGVENKPVSFLESSPADMSIDARTVWQEGTYRLKTSLVTVLPYYSELGPTANYGSKPEFDTSDLEIPIEDDNKIKYLSTIDKKRFEHHIKKLKLRVIWQDSELEDETLLSVNGYKENCVVLRCEIPLKQYKELVSWKENGRMAVYQFLSNIHTWNVDVSIKIWDDALKLLNDEKKKGKDFMFDANKGKRTIQIITSNQLLLSELNSKIKTLKVPEDYTTDYLDIDVLKYKTLDSAGLLTEIERSNPKTSTTLDTKRRMLCFKGPVSEVRNMKTGILNLLICTERVAVKQSVERAAILKSEKGKMLLREELMKRNLTENFEIKDAFCEICVFLKPPCTLKKTEKDLQESLDSVLTEETYTLPDNLILQGDEESTIVFKEIEKLNADAVIISADRQTITCIGVISAVKNAMENIKQHLQGEVYIKAKAEEIKQTKQALQREAEKISTFWFHLKRPWLANVIESLDTLQSLAETNKCLLQPEIGDTLADAGVSVVALSGDGTAVQIINCDIITQDTDVIVNVTNNQGVVAEAISYAAGPGVQKECAQHIEEKGKLADGAAVFTSAGKLNCREILHVVGPVWQDGQDEEKEVQRKVISNVLNMVSEKKYLSVMIPAISCGMLKYPGDIGTEQIVEAISVFVAKNPKSTVKEIYLCDQRQDMIMHFQNAVKKVLQKSWFIFEHNRQKKEAPAKTTTDEPGLSTIYLRPKSSRPGQRNDILGKSLRWGKEASYRSQSSALSFYESFSEDSDGRNMLRHHQPVVALPAIEEDGEIEINILPMTVNVTSQTKLTVMKGNIENQEQDVIVCTSPKFPDLIGAVAYALIRKGGAAIKNECRKKRSLQYGDVFRTKAGSLPCKQVFHVRTLADWKSGFGTRNVYQIVTSCLDMADRNGYVSLAFPAVGTDTSHYPADKVAEIMTEAIICYIKSKPDTVLKEVRIVICEKDTVKKFEEILPKLLAGTSPSNRPSDAFPSKINQHSPKAPVSNESEVSGAEKVKRFRAKYTEPLKVEQHSEADDVVLIQVTTAESNITDIKQKAEKLLDIDFLTTEIDFKELTDENVLTAEEVKRLQELNTTTVKVDIDQTAQKVMISGLRADVKQADNDACNLLRTDFPERRKQKKVESHIGTFVQWQVADGKQGRQNVSPEVNFELEMNYDRGVDFKYRNNGEEYQVLIMSLEEHPVQKPELKRKLYRQMRAGKDLGITVPATWAISDTDEDYEEVELQANDPTYIEVKKKLTSSGWRPMSIDKIIRIENRTLYLQYELMKKKIKIRNPKGIKNERELWHGTDDVTIKLICEKGFNRSFAGRNATAYGEGVYFAKHSGYSDRYAIPDGNNQQRMILTRVLTGEYVFGRQGMIAPPIKNDCDLYDSLVDNVKNPSIFVIFHDTQAYPQYVIEYT